MMCSVYKCLNQTHNVKLKNYSLFLQTGRCSSGFSARRHHRLVGSGLPVRWCHGGPADCLALYPTLLTSLSGTFLQRKDVVNQNLEFASTPAATLGGTRGAARPGSVVGACGTGPPSEAPGCRSGILSPRLVPSSLRAEKVSSRSLLRGLNIPMVPPWIFGDNDV